MSGHGDYQKIQREWDLWGPLFISLISAGLAAMSTKGSSQEAFTIIFIILWVGPLVIALNSRLLGQKMYFLSLAQKYNSNDVCNNLLFGTNFVFDSHHHHHE